MNGILPSRLTKLEQSLEFLLVPALKLVVHRPGTASESEYHVPFARHPVAVFRDCPGSRGGVEEKLVVVRESDVDHGWGFGHFSKSVSDGDAD